MRLRFYAVAVFAGLFLPAASAFGQTDLSMRRALYFTGSKTTQIDLKNDKYVAENGTITVSPLIATKCVDGGCFFNLGFIAFRSPATSTLSAGAVIETAIGGAGKTVSFAANEATQKNVLNVKLATGAQKVTFKIDPYKKIAESNENNNSFSVTIIVEGKP